MINMYRNLLQILSKTTTKLQTIQRHIQTLVHFDVELIEDVDIYSSLDSVAHTKISQEEAKVAVTMSVSKLERENRALQFQLKEAMRENKTLQAQMDEVEKMIVVARELKEENEGLIADYRKLKVCIL